MFEYQRMPVGNPWQSTIGGKFETFGWVSGKCHQAEIEH
jgi:hypothetical protein